MFVFVVLLAVIPLMTSTMSEDRCLKRHGSEPVSYVPSDAGHRARRRTGRSRAP
ncbi:MAG: hypothetical protein M0004_10190 [Actinomycetota bacterium]|nr:hypothetical protein [Actinomycetota bacterium]